MEWLLELQELVSIYFDYEKKLHTVITIQCPPHNSIKLEEAET